MYDREFLQDVVGEDDLDSYLAEERELGAERLEELTDDSPPSPTIVYKAPVSHIDCPPFLL